MSPATQGWGWQLAAALLGTSAFAILFGVPRKNYLDCGVAGLAGWAVYLAAGSLTWPASRRWR